VINSSALLNALQTHALRTGFFANVNGHEPKSPPQVRDQVTLSFWAGPIRVITSSGLSSASYRWDIIGRIYMDAGAEPGDAIDPALLDATFAFITSLAADFTLDSVLPAGSPRLRAIDFQGSDGEPVGAVPGYYDYEGTTYRAMDILIPLLINDVTDYGE
jgi:hypothetical protein